MTPNNTALRQRSGSVNSADPLVDFVYHLLRDHLPAGDVEKIMVERVFPEMRQGDTVSQFCNGYLANYAKDIADRLKPPTHLDMVLQAIYDRNAQEGRNRFFASNVVNHDPRTVSNPEYLILWEWRSSDPHEATLIFSGPWNRLLTYLDEIQVGESLTCAAAEVPSCPQDLQGLHDAITREGNRVYAVLAQPAICQALQESTDPAFDRGTESRFLAVGLVGYWHRIPVFQRLGLQTQWVLV